jgi:hypothetical protein
VSAELSDIFFGAEVLEEQCEKVKTANFLEYEHLDTNMADLLFGKLPQPPHTLRSCTPLFHINICGFIEFYSQ